MSPKSKRNGDKKSLLFQNFKKYTVKEKDSDSRSFHKSHRIASPQHKRNSNFFKTKLKPFYSPNIKSNKESKIKTLFENQKSKHKKGNTFQERVDRFKIESRLLKKKTSSKINLDEEDQDLSENFEFFINGKNSVKAQKKRKFSSNFFSI